MNTYYVSDEVFKNSKQYQEFLKNNPKEGILNIRVFTASGAIPVSNLQVVVSTIYEKNKFIFFEGFSDSSGIIEPIKLPAPIISSDDLIVPNSLEYEILATYLPDNIVEIFKIKIFENVNVVQNINIIPTQGEY